MLSCLAMFPTSSYLILATTCCVNSGTSVMFASAEQDRGAATVAAESLQLDLCFQKVPLLKNPWHEPHMINSVAPCLLSRRSKCWSADFFSFSLFSAKMPSFFILSKALFCSTFGSNMGALTFSLSLCLLFKYLVKAACIFPQKTQGLWGFLPFFDVGLLSTVASDRGWQVFFSHELIQYAADIYQIRLAVKMALVADTSLNHHSLTKYCSCG